ncbi:uncharacterized protein Tco025E_08046 [Trypanosoma conorhini]|uniref:Uncharacterized protein n=1 Tax=Trypanosoma conorhini TaxID=83891 RepID=A0A422NFS1_9TRYP|nr:uncharacterized protein Tco025E_08046 [Trypanosoma conorhini]RNF04318.1 hypothetical protein Tco025E_08046 [Trypanosoma conorhini]
MTRGCKLIAPAQVGVRFLPIDEVCSFSVGGDDGGAAKDVKAEQGLGFRALGLGSTRDLSLLHLQQVPANDTVSMSSLPDSITSSGFLSALRSAVSYTLAGDSITSGPVKLREEEIVDKHWLDLLKLWPLDLAASGYAEWWLRHPRCRADATDLFKELLRRLEREERLCRNYKRDFSREEPNSDALQGALGMLQSISADPPSSLKGMFRDPFYHQQLFYLSCRVGAHAPSSWYGRKQNTGVLAACLSLAAATAQQIRGDQLQMRHDLIRFLGNVQREWQSLLELRPDEVTLRLEFSRVRTRLTCAME